MRWTLLAPLLLLAQIAAGAAAARVPVVVELYTAQGCASCQKSDALVAALDRRPGVIPLTFSVDYWDYLGWKDTFAQPAFSQRQRAYDKRFGLRDVFTPQIIVDGRSQAPGDKQDNVRTQIVAALRARSDGPRIEPRADGTIAVDAGRRPERSRRGADVWLVRYDPRVNSVLVKEGDNRGQTAVYGNTVRQLARLGSWSGRRRIFHLPAPPEDGLDTLIIVQAPDGGRILSARKA